jgi:hypothetical protein
MVRQFAGRVLKCSPHARSCTGCLLLGSAVGGVLPACAGANYLHRLSATNGWLADPQLAVSRLTTSMTVFLERPSGRRRRQNFPAHTRLGQRA